MKDKQTDHMATTAMEMDNEKRELQIVGRSSESVSAAGKRGPNSGDSKSTRGSVIRKASSNLGGTISQVANCSAIAPKVVEGTKGTEQGVTHCWKRSP